MAKSNDKRQLEMMREMARKVQKEKWEKEQLMQTAKMVLPQNYTQNNLGKTQAVHWAYDSLVQMGSTPMGRFTPMPARAADVGSDRFARVGPFTENQQKQLSSLLIGNWKRISGTRLPEDEYWIMIDLQDPLKQRMSNQQKAEYQEGYDKGFEEAEAKYKKKET